MRWKLQLAVLLGLSLTHVASLAQGPPADQRLATLSADSDVYPPEDAGYFDSDGVARFQLIHGRLCLDAPRHRKGAQHFEQDGVYESITITALRGVPSVHYVHRTPKHEITLSVQDAKTVRIESLLTGPGELATIEQPAVSSVGDNKIRWRISQNGVETNHVGATILHLRHRDAKRFDRHYGQLLRRLLRGRTLKSLSEETDHALIEYVRKESPIRLEAIHQAIDLLASTKSGTRRSAERFLLSCGSPVLPIIADQSGKDLDAEQRHRLRHIVRALQPLTDDTPASLAALLVNDTQHWSQIATRLDSTQTQLANRYLRGAGFEVLPAVSVDSPTDSIERVARTEPMNVR